jgi:lipopolysaccharide biosynthesis regulator YciM
MELDLQWLLIGLPLAFALGWMASRMDLRQFRRDNRDAPRAYFKGLNLLLNEQQDQAIDAFIEAVQSDPDTAELHFALGNLFRRRGDFDRAVRVHEHLLQRGDLKQHDRDRARRALAQDFMKAGLFDRAEQAWRALLSTGFAAEAQLALLQLYERSRDWRQAAEMAAALESAGRGDFGQRIAHHWCEIAEEADAQGRGADAQAALAMAEHAAPQAPRPLVLAGRRLADAGRHGEAMTQWERLREHQPAAFTLVGEDYARSAIAAGEVARARQVLQALFERSPGTSLAQALTLLEPADQAAQMQRLAHQLERQPTLSAAASLLQRPASIWPEAALKGLRTVVGDAASSGQRYRCAACGFEAQHYFWQCPGCLSWDSYPAMRIEEQ